MKRKYWVLISIFSASILIFFDQLTKYWVRRDLGDGSSYSIIDGVFRLIFHKNAGAAWGIMQGKVNILSIMSILITAAVIFFMCKLPLEKKYAILHIIGIFLCSGAIGNLIDRVYFNYVTDFLYFELIDFPVFNVADCYITGSMILLIILVIFYYKEEDFTFLDRKKKDSNEE